MSLTRIRPDLHLPARPATTLIVGVLEAGTTFDAAQRALLVAADKAHVAVATYAIGEGAAAADMHRAATVAHAQRAIEQYLATRSAITRVVLFGGPAETVVLQLALGLVDAPRDIGVAWDLCPAASDLALHITWNRALHARVIPYTSTTLIAELELIVARPARRAAANA